MSVPEIRTCSTVRATKATGGSPGRRSRVESPVSRRWLPRRHTPDPFPKGVGGDRLADNSTPIRKDLGQSHSTPNEKPCRGASPGVRVTWNLLRCRHVPWHLMDHSSIIDC